MHAKPLASNWLDAHRASTQCACGELSLSRQHWNCHYIRGKRICIMRELAKGSAPGLDVFAIFADQNIPSRVRRGRPALLLYKSNVKPLTASTAWRDVLTCQSYQKWRHAEDWLNVTVVANVFWQHKWLKMTVSLPCLHTTACVAAEAY